MSHRTEANIRLYGGVPGKDHGYNDRLDGTQFIAIEVLGNTLYMEDVEQGTSCMFHRTEVEGLGNALYVIDGEQGTSCKRFIERKWRCKGTRFM